MPKRMLKLNSLSIIKNQKVNDVNVDSSEVTVKSKKTLILQTAHNLFKQYGFHNVGVDRIIDDSKIAKMTFYNNFGSKENLIINCLEYEIDHQKNSILDLIFELDSDDHKAHLKAIYSWHVSYINNPEYNGCMLNKAVIELWFYENVISTVESFNTWKFCLIESVFNQLNLGTPNARIFFNAINGLMIPANKYIPTWQDLEILTTN